MTTASAAAVLENGSTGPQLVCGSDSPLVALVRAAQRLAQSDATVLLVGETGTGKELLARVIHGLSQRALCPLVQVSCAASLEPPLEDELFGAESGASPGRPARAGETTLLLDDVAELPLRLQSRLLQLLQEPVQPGKAPYRIIAATSHDLAAEVAAGRFRRDLYYRLLVCPLELPPLRCRPGDVRVLLGHFRARTRAAWELAPGVAEALEAYHWPGNVRELENLVDRLNLLIEGPIARMSDLPPELRLASSRGDATPDGTGSPAALHPGSDAPATRAGSSAGPPAPRATPPRDAHRPGAPEGAFDPELLCALAARDGSPLLDPSSAAAHPVDLPRMLRNLEEAYIAAALRRTRGNKKAAADLLGLQRTTLVEKLRRRRKQPAG